MLQWIIIGGGLHGTFLSHALVHAGGEPRDRVAVLDPHARPLQEWSRLARNLRMEFLRSLSTEHLDLDPSSLLRFARTVRGRGSARFLATRHCPSLDLFLEHSRWVVRRFHLDELRRRGVARRLTLHSSFVRVETDRGALSARQVVLAVGRNDRCSLLPGARTGPPVGEEIRHAFDPDLDFDALTRHRRVAVVGGGMSAAHLADALCRRRVLVAIFARHGVRVRDFDADLRWGVSPRTRHRYFPRDITPGERCGYPGTMTPELAQAIRRHLHRGQLRWQQATVQRVSRQPGNATVHVAGRPPETFDRVILATGYAATALPAWVRDMAEEEGLPMDDRGFPVLQDDLRWRSRVHVTGAPATCILGPLAANIAGARLAAERLGIEMG